MRVAIVHYHLNPGGVTRVIEHAVKSLDQQVVRTVVLTGLEPTTGFPGKWRLVEGLQYEQFRPAVTAKELADQMVAAATQALGGAPDLFHVHNHSLGKNMVLPDALVELAEQGYGLLLQIHDFAEDGRPANYRKMISRIAQGDALQLPGHLYPRGDHVHYAVINGRDYSFLKDAGAQDSCLHLVPNPVDLSSAVDDFVPPQATDSFQWIYPTRAIRRKNLGEFLLWAAVAPEHHRFATTLGPENPQEIARYSRWKEVAWDLGLPVSFEIGRDERTCFVSLLRRADALMTTSVTEGFGLAYLEPWLVGRPVTGRILDEITSEFKEAGIVLPWGYRRVGIPVAWLDMDQVVGKIQRGLETSMTAYGRTPDQGDLERVLAAWIEQETVDFGRLDEELQETVIRRLARNKEEGQHILPNQLPRPDEVGDTVAANQRILKQKYCLQAYGHTLARLYRHVAGSPVSAVKSLNGEALLDHFLAPERLYLLRVD